MHAYYNDGEYGREEKKDVMVHISFLCFYLVENWRNDYNVHVLDPHATVGINVGDGVVLL